MVSLGITTVAVQRRAVRCWHSWHDCKLDAWQLTFKISFGNLLVASPTFSGEPNIASYGDLLMPSWKRRFLNWMNFNPTAYLVVSLSRIQLTIMSWMSASDRSTLHCDCGYAEAYHTYSTGIWTWMQILYYCVSEWHRKLWFMRCMQQSMLINTRGRAILVMKTLKDRLIKWWQEAIRFFNHLFQCRNQQNPGVRC
jgi:hypothetical protein